MQANSPIELFKQKCPTIINFLSKEKKFWNKQFLRQSERIEYFRNQISEGKTVIPDSSFFDLAIRAFNGEYYYGDLLNYIDESLKYIINHSPSLTYPKIRKKVKSMISGFSIDRANFLDWAGELLLHSLFIKEGNDIIEIETKLPNGKRVDFKISKNNESPILIEVFSIDLRGKAKISDNDLEYLLDQKISEKINDKFKGLNLENYNPLFQILVWTGISFIREHRKLFKNYINLDVEHQFCFLLSLNNQEKKQSCFEFGSLNYIINKHF